MEAFNVIHNIPYLEHTALWEKWKIHWFYVSPENWSGGEIGD